MKSDLKGMEVHVPAEIDVAKDRKDLKMTDANLYKTFGFNLGMEEWAEDAGSAAPTFDCDCVDVGAVSDALHAQVLALGNMTCLSLTAT